MYSQKMQERITKYYDQAFRDYWWILGTRRHFGMHCAFYDEEHRTHDAAILNSNRILARKAGVKENVRVLDAGCGVGGSAIWLAKHTGAKITGITLSASQCQKAQKLAEEQGVAGETKFFVRDFLDTGFPDNHFDVVWFLESACHAEDKYDLLREAYRVLAPQGRLVIADGFQKKETLDIEEAEIMRKWLDSWAVPNLAHVSNFASLVQKSGFKNIRQEDVTENIRPFSQWLYRRSMVAYPIIKIFEWLHLRSREKTSNVEGALWHYRTLRRGLWAYMIYTAEK